MITYHPWYHNFNPSVANKCLDEAAQLGAGYIRIDVRWKDLIPDRNNVNEAVWAWYDSYLRAAREWYGLQPFIVLSNAPTAVMQDSVDLRLTAWNRFVDEVAHRVGTMCTMYQLLNEPNSPVYRIFPTNVTATAIRSASKIVHQHNPQAQIAINILAGLWRWQSDIEELLRECGTAVDIVGLDYYPGTWNVSSQTDSANWNHLLDFLLTRRKITTSPMYGRPLAIIETGYSTNLQTWRSEKHQLSYFRTLQDAITHFDAGLGADGLVLVGIHELSDSDSHAFLDPEAHFGLLSSGTMERKAAFDVVAQIFSTLRSESP